ncbi:hypothetical protein DSO57_1027314 [Entomophthora muscae]|uniref:Uncharacterized protein n=1 Tax=Entomophthora muscae TaxID=34485 RepID=A0ACC2RSR0_9FUNG|nr:hypothetical protein DSO57_1027314 [Entomophthora muscae]
MVGIHVEGPAENSTIALPSSTHVRRSRSDSSQFVPSKPGFLSSNKTLQVDGIHNTYLLTRQKSDSASYLRVLEPQSLKKTASAGLGWLQELWKGWSNDEPIGPTLTSKYDIVKRRIGSGTTSQIQLVRKIGDESKRVLAVKLFYKKWRDSGDLEARVGEEFCLASGLNHKNVIKVHELIQDDLGHWCQVMDYCPGGDLRCVIQDGFLNRPEIDCCFRQLIDGVAYMHSMGIAHRDIKPDNILIDDDCVLKLTDFGCSEAFYDSAHISCNKTRGILGSEPYMAPEILEGQQQTTTVSTYDPRLADIWACGIVYLVMSFGSMPFKIANESRDKAYVQYLSTRLAKEGYPPFKTLSKGCRELLLKILDPNVDTRATMSEIVNNPWFSSTEVCIKGQATSSFHLHFSQDYCPTNSL